MDDAAKKRVQIARDSLAQLEAGGHVPVHGRYVRRIGGLVASQGRTFREVMAGPCEVCAIGTLLLGVMGQSDVVIDGLGVLFSSLEPYFSVEQLMAIECAFEGDTYHSYYKSYGSLEVQEFSNRAPWAAPIRVREILYNIIRNDGTFLPADTRVGPPPPPVEEPAIEVGPAVVLRGESAPRAALPPAKAQVV